MVARVRTPIAPLARVRGGLAQHAAIQVVDSGWRLFVKTDKGEASLEGTEAIKALSLLLPAINQNGASQKQLEEALAMIDRAGGSNAYLRSGLPAVVGTGLQLVDRLPVVVRTAIEIASAEEVERRALLGELAAVSLSQFEARERSSV